VASGVSLFASGPDCGTAYSATVDEHARRIEARDGAVGTKHWNATAREGRNRPANPLASRPDLL